VSGTRLAPSARTRQHDALCRRAFWTLFCLVSLICLPLLAIVILISRTSAPDLFDLVPNDGAASDGYMLLAWYDLERGRQALKEGGVATGARIRALGYMMDGDQPVRDGQSVRTFVLLPDKGNAVHPAHRFGDQMIDVQLPLGDSVRFSRGSLIWVRGTLIAFSGDPGGPQPLYRLENARVEPAKEREIPIYFR
jgi:hypothetical protein